MRKFLIILLISFSGLSFSQEKKKSLDETINTSLDSLSKLYNKIPFNLRNKKESL
jgi:hypothetical protein